MNEEEFMAWENKKSDLSLKISNMFHEEQLAPNKAISVLMNTLTTTFITLKFMIGKEGAEKAFDFFIKDLKDEFKAKMELFKDQHDIEDLLAKTLFDAVTRKP